MPPCTVVTQDDAYGFTTPFIFEERERESRCAKILRDKLPVQWSPHTFYIRCMSTVFNYCK